MASGRSGWRKIAQSPGFLLRSFFVLWILDARVKHVLNGESERFGDDLNLPQSQVTLV